ncbi:MAG TPA: M23 family metallopeptidase [Bdellovibrionota bacterium]|nr:M23 family metallopeptidase [Bdellovibrionota bacterium]
MTARLLFALSSFVACGLAFAAPDETAVPLAEIADGARAALSSKESPAGSILLISLETEDVVAAEKVVGSFDDKEIPFFAIGEKSFGAVFGVNHDLKPGDYQVEIRVGEAKGQLPLKVLDGGFKSENIKVNPKHVNPPKGQLKRIKREQAEIGRIYRELTREKHWAGAFKLPIESPVTSPFGTRRMYNGEQRNYHPGMDLKAAVGTPIVAPAKGRVVLAKHLYFTGKTVGIDHGYGVITLYAHMSKIRVKEGEVVDTGKVLGLSGMTGRVSGPHLHWQAVIQGVKVNPLDLTKVMR